MLTQLYIESGDDRAEFGETDLWAALPDLMLLFLLYVQKTHAVAGGTPSTLYALAKMARMFVEYVTEIEEKHGGDFREFLQEQALEAFGGDGRAED